eukprot:791772-Rhodomonas_salina.4
MPRMPPMLTTNSAPEDPAGNPAEGESDPPALSPDNPRRGPVDEDALRVIPRAFAGPVEQRVDHDVVFRDIDHNLGGTKALALGHRQDHHDVVELPQRDRVHVDVQRRRGCEDEHGLVGSAPARRSVWKLAHPRVLQSILAVGGISSRHACVGVERVRRIHCHALARPADGPLSAARHSHSNRRRLDDKGPGRGSCRRSGLGADERNSVCDAGFEGVGRDVQVGARDSEDDLTLGRVGRVGGDEPLERDRSAGARAGR